jgi:hypothetical protein
MGFASGLKAQGAKTDNHEKAMPAKVALRREALAAVGAGNARVLDLFGGRGEMFGRVWNEAASYLGNDKDAAKALAHPGLTHNAPALVLVQALDLARFNVVDFDAYGSPWEEIAAFCRRRKLAPGETLALVITDGSPRRAMLGLTAHALARLAGVDPNAAGAHARWAELGRAGLAAGAAMMGGSLRSLRQAAGGPGSRGMWYALALVDGPPAPQGRGKGAGRARGPRAGHGRAPRGQDGGPRAGQRGQDAPEGAQGAGQEAPESPGPQDGRQGRARGAAGGHGAGRKPQGSPRGQDGRAEGAQNAEGAPGLPPGPPAGAD